MIQVGERLPDFSLQAVEPGPVDKLPVEPFVTITGASTRGKWLVLFFWPMDFTFVCPTEIVEFGRKAKDFAERGAQLLGASTDTQYVHIAWRRENAQLRDLPIAMLADTKRELSTKLGILHKEEGVPLRATLIVDPEGFVRHVSATDLNVGRSVPEVLRVLDALQTGEMCPVNWTKGQPTIKV